MRRNIFQEYAEGTADGIAAYFQPPEAGTQNDTGGTCAAIGVWA